MFGQPLCMSNENHKQQSFVLHQFSPVVDTLEKIKVFLKKYVQSII